MIVGMGVWEFWVNQIFFWISGFVFSYPLKRRERFWLRVFCFVAIVLAYSAIFWSSIWDGNVSEEYLSRFISVILLFAMIYSCWDTHVTVALYNTIWSVVLWQLLSEVFTVIEFRASNIFAENTYLWLCALILLFAVNNGIVALTIGKWMPIDRRDRIGPRQLISASLLFLIIEVLAFSRELRHVSEYNFEWKYLYICQMICVILLYLQNELFKKSAIRQDLEIMNLLWKNKQDQYHLSKENIALLNQKSHDLKHQIRALRQMSQEEISNYLDDLEDTVEIYESIVKTGNDVFDTILTEKSLYCKKHGIKIHCVADGSQLGFINTIDLYTILGNAIDNAIEAVQEFDEVEKRQIDVQISRQKNFLVMHFMNPIEKSIVFSEELPVTTKSQIGFHGFGLRSIRHFVKKYDGMMNVSEENGCFSLKIMIPLP